MAKEVKVEAPVEAYPDGTPIVRYPKWIYPGGKPAHNSPDKKTGHNGVLVNSKEEHDEYVSEHPEFGDGKAKGWDTNVNS